MEGETLKDLILADDTKDEIFFTEGVFYSWWAQSGRMLDITAAVNEPLTEFGEDESVADKMQKNVKEALEVDGKIYALPFWEGNYSMVYNATLFDEEEWYIAEDGGYTGADGKLSAGPDGQKGTYDDGMPATYDEFFALLEKIKKDNCTPFQFPGASQEYVAWLASELAADNMGYDQFMLNYTMNGEADLVKMDTVDWDTMQFETEKVQITSENAYELARQPGILYATDFVRRLLQNTNNYDANNSLSGSFKIAQSQLEFVRNPTISSAKNVAIMVDGLWWENEATAVFSETYGSGSDRFDSDMEYKIMPLPKANESYVGSENVFVSTNDAYCFIKSNIAPEKVEVATKFVQFLYTDAQLSEFTEMTGLMKNVDYEVDEDQLTSYAKSVREYRAASKVAVPMSNNELYLYKPADFRIVHFMKSKYDGGSEATDAIVLGLTKTSGGKYEYGTKEYVNGIISYRKNEQWNGYASVLKK